MRRKSKKKCDLQGLSTPVSALLLFGGAVGVGLIVLWWLDTGIGSSPSISSAFKSDAIDPTPSASTIGPVPYTAIDNADPHSLEKKEQQRAADEQHKQDLARYAKNAQPVLPPTYHN
jgi:hypothetical protein